MELLGPRPQTHKLSIFCKFVNNNLDIFEHNYSKVEHAYSTRKSQINKFIVCTTTQIPPWNKLQTI